MRDFRGLQVWEKSHGLVLELYRITKTFPREEMYGLVSQIRRCGASIPANIAEGCGRKGNGEFHRFLQIASGSGSELDYHLLLARDLGFMNDADHRKATRALVEIRRMLSALIRKVDLERHGS
jgi:four helix bundle protein